MGSASENSDPVRRSRLRMPTWSCCSCGQAASSRRSKRKELAAMNSAADAAAGKVAPAGHLVVLVNGIVGSANNWLFASGQFKERLPDQVLVHCSICNSAWRTFHGVDVMGKRLAEEIQEVVDRTPGVQKISFVAHSLGGLIARYAISQLVREEETEGEDGPTRVTLAGLEPMNFVTLATPHLGSRGNKQLPFLFGLSALESLAPYMAHWFIGQTGKHLFLTDGDPPLLRRMVTDCEEGKFMTALRSFHQRAVYSNISHDHLVGWRTSSIRRESELPKIRLEAMDDKYPHIVRVEEDASAAELKPHLEENGRADTTVEEEMVSALSRLSWRRVDISFWSARSPFAAHNTIQVKKESQHYEGAGIISHIIDNFCL